MLVLIMKITDASINRPMLVTVVIIVMLILGGISLSRMSIDLFPEMKLPVGAVITSYPGVGPEEIEEQITKPLESVLSTVNDLDTVRSISSMGTSAVIILFDWGKDMDFAALEMREKVDLVRRFLPEGAEDPMILKMDPTQMPIMQVAISSSDLAGLKQVCDDIIQPRLERVGGVGSIWTAGGFEREIQVLVDPAKLQGYGLTLNGLVNALRGENMNVSSGTVVEGKKDYLVRVTGEFKDLQEIEDVVVSPPGSAPVHIIDLAKVVDGQKKTTQYSRVDGLPGLTMYIMKQSGANTVGVARNVRKTLNGLKKELPDVKFNIITDQSEFIEMSIAHVIREILVGGILAVLIIWFFLRNLRSTLIISTAIPISIISTFVLLYFSGMTLNLISMGGLALGVGLIVDDAIVVLENIFRHRQQGYGMIEAARVATDEVGSPVIASTLTTMAVFLPIIFVQGLAAELFKPMALTVSFSVFASLIVALTLVPLLSSRWMSLEEPGKKSPLYRPYRVSERFHHALENNYKKLLDWALEHRRRVLIGITVIFILSIGVLALVGFEFIPAMDAGYIQVTVDMPKGSSLEETNQVVTRIEKIAEGIPEAKGIFAGVGISSEGGMMGTGSTDQGQVGIDLGSKLERKKSDQEIINELRRKVKEIPGAAIKVTASNPAFQMPGFAPVEIQILGDDLDTLAGLGDQAAKLIRQVPGTSEVESSLEEGRPEVQVLVHRDRAATYGLSPAEVASTVRTAIDGVVATRYRTGGEEVDIRLQLAEGASARLNDLAGVDILSPGGTKLPLSQVASLNVTTGPQEIERQDRTRLVTVSSQLSGRDLNSVTREIRTKLASLHLPPGYWINIGGEQEMMSESFSSLGLAMILAMILVYLLMVAQFESALYPFIIMFSVPVTLIGIVFSLLITGRAFSVPAFIGVIMLVGIVVKNAIVLIDYVNKLRDRGLSRREALLKAGPTRLRPILMTALTAILAMFPMALAIGEGAEVQAPMATVVIGGLAFSTLITLVLVPVIYDTLDNWKERRRSKPEGKALGSPAPDAKL